MDNIHDIRLEKLRNLLDKKKIDTLMVSTEANRFYLSGFTGEDTQCDESAGTLFITRTKLILATDSRFEKQAAAEAGQFELYCYKKGIPWEIHHILNMLDTKHLGIEDRRISFYGYSQIQKTLTNAGLDIELVPAGDMVESLRLIKQENEIEATRKALYLAETVFEHFLKVLSCKMTEKQAAWAMEKGMREAGAEKLSFPAIAASGPNSALPHAIPGDRMINANEPLLFDWGARLGAYCSDTSRTVILGRSDGRYKKIYRTVREAQQKAISALRPGIHANEVDKIARRHIDQSEFKGTFGHGLGHGTGLVVHEEPRLSPLCDTILQPGMIVTVEPGIYIADWGGVRIENQVVIREDGCEVLNTLSTDRYIEAI
ncbi:MAG: aminopeptidase P family protein [Deltaproteobacteria bacterium]|nr:aminopeptidase P family protein [Deltaproteobacteria bacterium]